MWSPRNRRDRKTVVCIACGDSLLRSEAREYDKEGDRWDRRNKEFEHLCRDCHDDLCHQPRAGLESLLCSIDAGRQDRSTFLERYTSAVEAGRESSDPSADGDRSGSDPDPEFDSRTDPDGEFDRDREK
ncbi:hypothetical protein ACERIT_00570 [Halopenitus sp. H-Gu1]|uniref:DUF7562 family protein n=1 Tax=Halopenitus sp. H-Gu1 TaxID=3242697 RepID=UPI00359EDA50